MKTQFKIIYVNIHIYMAYIHKNMHLCVGHANRKGVMGARTDLKGYGK